MGTRRLAGILGLTAGLCLAAGSSRAGEMAQLPKNQLVVTSAHADMAAELLTIYGRNLAEVSPPRVWLAGAPLVVLSASPYEILAVLPPDLAPGSYLLTVESGPGESRRDSFDLTAGAAGPEGPPGPPGPTGSTGSPGLPGEKGDPGQTGEPGPPGAKGMQWRGPWNGGLEYAADDAVGHEGSSWIALRASAGVVPAEGDDWSLLAGRGEEGSPGEPGTPGAAGSPGPPGAKGDPGERGEKGDKGDKGDPGAPGGLASLEGLVGLPCDRFGSPGIVGLALGSSGEVLLQCAPAPVPPILEFSSYVKASNTGAGDFFGYSVSLSADFSTLAVGAPYEASGATGIGGDQADDSATRSGAVYVFRRNGDTWTQEAYLKASNTGVNDFFGYSVSLSADGSALAVGAYGEDSSATGIGGDQADDSAAYSGAVYVFERSGATWSQAAYLKASNTGGSDFFGYSVSLSADGGTLAVGAFGEDGGATGIGGDQADDPAAYSSGAVYVFERSGAAWSQGAYLKASNTGAYDFFGSSVTLSGDGSTLAVGAWGEASGTGTQDNNFAASSGAVYVFRHIGDTWSQEDYVKASRIRPYDSFGSSVSLSADGSALAAGAYRADGTAVSGGAVVDSGTVEVFRRLEGVWHREAHLEASNAGAYDSFGYSVSLSADGSTLAVGAPAESSGATGIGGDEADDPAAYFSGAVYVFRRGEGGWGQRAYVKASNTGAGDRFGTSVSLSAAGLVVGAYGEASGATGIGGDQADSSATFSGAVYVYGVIASP